MTTLFGALETLIELLGRENAALRALDLPAAAALVRAKRDATATMQASLGESTEADREQLKVLATQLQEVSLENKLLLERAIRAQQHVMAIMARAARKTLNADRYGAHGSYLAQPGNPAFALRAQA